MVTELLYILLEKLHSPVKLGMDRLCHVHHHIHLLNCLKEGIHSQLVDLILKAIAYGTEDLM